MRRRRDALYDRIAMAALVLGGAAAGLLLDEASRLLRRPPAPAPYQEVWAMEDEAARYVPRPGTYPPFLGADLRVSRLGLRGPELERADVLALGDSCTFGVKVPEARTYAGLLSAKGLVTANAGVPGYNTYLGLQRLRTAGLLPALKPRLVVLYFGWNDQWRVPATERALARVRRAVWPLGLGPRLARLQALLYDPRYWLGRLRLVPQVPLDDYQANLERMISLSREAGARVVLVTSAAHSERMGAYFPDLLEDFRRSHGAYNEAARRVAAKTGARLVDFAAEVERLSPEERATLFVDPVHLSAEGHARLARELLEAAKELGVRPRRARARG